MASEALNVNSALYYIAQQAQLPIEAVRSWYSYESSNRSKILNIKSAKLILDRMLDIGFDSTFSIAYSGSDQQACSANTFKDMYNKAMTGLTWNIITTSSELLYGKYYRTLSPISLTATLVGGGGGGSGGGKTNFDGSGTLTIQAGGKGGTTEIRKNGSRVCYASGGNGGAGQTAQNGVRDAGNGSAGSSGNTLSDQIISLNVGDELLLVVGYGGGGSGSGILRVTKNNSYSGTVYTPTLNNGGNGGQFGNYDPRCAAGGGAGGKGCISSFDNIVSPGPAIGTLITGNPGTRSNSGNADGQDGASATDFYFNIIGSSSTIPYVGTFSKGGKGGNSGSAATGGSGGGSAGSGGGAGATSGTNGYASAGGGGASGKIDITTTTCYFNQID